MAQETQTGALYQPRGVGWGGRWEGDLRLLKIFHALNVSLAILTQTNFDIDFNQVSDIGNL